MLNNVIFVGRILNVFTNTEEPIIEVKTTNKDLKQVIVPVILSSKLFEYLKSIFEGTVEHPIEEQLIDTFVGVKGCFESIDDKLLVRCDRLTVLNKSKIGQEVTKGGDVDDSEQIS